MPRFLKLLQSLAGLVDGINCPFGIDGVPVREPGSAGNVTAKLVDELAKSHPAICIRLSLSLFRPFLFALDLLFVIDVIYNLEYLIPGSRVLP